MIINWRRIAYACIFTAGQQYGHKDYILMVIMLLCSVVSFWFYDHGSLSDKVTKEEEKWDVK